MNRTKRYPVTYWFIFVLVLNVASALAAPEVDIEFEIDESTGKERIHATANCHTNVTDAYKTFNAIVNYPELHQWIQNTKAESSVNEYQQEFLIEFHFPWPVGRQWSRVRVKRDGESVISWDQIEGTLNINQGRIAINKLNEQAHVDYSAIIDMGYPDAFTRSYKKQFVTEFLTAMYREKETEKGTLPFFAGLKE